MPQDKRVHFIAVGEADPIEAQQVLVDLLLDERLRRQREAPRLEEPKRDAERERLISSS
jgi:hypothetical protein